jgi:hypothetical protein
MCEGRPGHGLLLRQTALPVRAPASRALAVDCVGLDGFPRASYSKLSRVSTGGQPRERQSFAHLQNHVVEILSVSRGHQQTRSFRMPSRFFAERPEAFRSIAMLIFFGACLCSAGLQPSVRTSLMQISRLSALRLAAQKEAPGQVRCENMAAAIVGIGIKITRVVGKRKLSQNKEARDIQGAGDALIARNQPKIGAAMLACAAKKT